MDSQGLKKLQLKWYLKLKESGFKDIEDSQGYLISSANHNLGMTRLRLWRRSKEEYYRLAAGVLFERKFPKGRVLSEEHYKAVWKLHIEGMSYREIGKIMGLSKSSVQFRIRRMRRIFFKSER